MARTSSSAAPFESAPPGLIVPGDRPADVVTFEGETVAFFLEAAELLGVPKSVAAIYGVIFASPAPVSFGELGARLNLSKGSISQGLRVLREVGAVKEVSTAEERMERFEPDLELRKLVQRFLENRLRKQLEAGSQRLGTLQQLLPAGRDDDAELLRKRLKSLSDWHRKTRALLPLAKTFLKIS